MCVQPFLGFVLLTHEKPNQIVRLIDRLNFMFDHPPIACHHDFSQCDLPLAEIPENVSFVKPHLKTAWGDWSLVEATLKGIELLYERPDNPQWFTLLSGRDYPIKPAEKIINDFKSSKCDVHISSLKLAKSNLDSDYARQGYKKYNTLVFKYPSLVHLMQSIRLGTWYKKDIYLHKKILTKWVVPFTNKFHCYYGSQWFSANQKATEYILKFNKSNSRIRFYYKRVHAPDESYFHTIVGNSDELKTCDKKWRHIQWVPTLQHPKELSAEDLPQLLESKDHFARKFNIDKYPEILDRLDEHIGYN
ncbi:MAG: beta-1,6-N-acetylglucosaminyltransferase [Balneolaceae bacterium]|nr:beta-1,6-N-acetylglucosaminyltransferase [Balneolaceae bacterium]